MNNSLEGRVQNLESSVWGNGRVGLLTRMSMTEGDMENVKSDVAAIKKMFWSVILGILMILGGLAADIARHAK